MRVLDGVEVAAVGLTPAAQYEAARGMLVGLEPDELLAAAAVATRMLALQLVAKHRRNPGEVKRQLDAWRARVLLDEVAG